MTSWHDLRIWLSGFLGGIAVVAFVAATVMRVRERIRQHESHAVPGRPVANADVNDKSNRFLA